jgi:hypothetical protein
MDINCFIKNNLNNIIDDFVDSDINKINNCSVKFNSNNSTIDENCDSDSDSDDGDDDDDGFYSKGEIYGYFSDDDEGENDEDNIRQDEYKELQIFMKKEKNIIPEINEDYVEENENFKDIVDDEYEKLYKKSLKEDNINDEEKEDDENAEEEDNAFKLLFNNEKNNIKEMKNNIKEMKNTDEQVLDETLTKKSKLKIVKFNDDLNKYINNYSNNKNNSIIENDKEDEDEEEEENTEIENDKGEYMFDMINLFMKYFNKKYGQKQNLFSGIKNEDVDTNKQMELFASYIAEYEYIKEKIFMDECSEFYFDDIKMVKKYLNNNDIENFYVLEILETKNDKKIYSPSLLDCLNYLHKNKITENDWNIYDLK